MYNIHKDRFVLWKCEKVAASHNLKATLHMLVLFAKHHPFSPLPQLSWYLLMNQTTKLEWSELIFRLEVLIY